MATREKLEDDERDITERLASHVADITFHGGDVVGGSLACEARHDIIILREALMVALGVGGDANDPMVQEQIACAKNAAIKSREPHP